MFKNLSNLRVLLRLKDFNNLGAGRRFAGHSKWANIKHQKAITDAKRANVFAKISRSIKVAIAEGGSADPKSNVKLQQVIDQGKRISMPLATIQSVIKSTQHDKTKAKSYTMEIIGPGGCFILCDVFTESFHVTKQTIATILRKHGCKFSDGGAKHGFEQKGIIFVEKLENVDAKNMLEVATDHAIESGAEDVQLFDDDTLQFSCSATSLPKVEKEIEKLNYKIKSSEVECVPIKLHTISDSDIDICSSLFDKLENLPQVVKLFDNIA